MKILFAGGGTGGHINPALAVAKHLRALYPDCDIRFAGAEGQMEERLVPREGFRLYTFPLHGLRRSFAPKALVHNMKAVLEAQSATGRAKKIIREFAPDVIVGTGGYASFPVANAGTKLGIPTVLLEVNAMPGFVTRRLSGSVTKVLISYRETLPYLKKPEIAVVTGNPVRDEITFADCAAARAKLGLSDQPLVVSFWGSLGALYMNRKMVDFLRMAEEGGTFRHIHAAGKHSYAWMPEELKKAGVDPAAAQHIELREYIYDMETVMAAADLVICRAGASTLSELCVLGKPSVIVPSPNVTDNHQEKNARALESHGACEVLLENECTGETLYHTVSRLLSDRERLTQLGNHAKEQALPNATEEIAKELLALIRK